MNNIAWVGLAIVFLCSGVESYAATSCTQTFTDSKRRESDFITALKCIEQKIHSQELFSARKEGVSDSSSKQKTTESCEKDRFTKENQYFVAKVEEFSHRGNTASISVSVENKTSEDIVVSIFRTYAILTSPSGESQKKSGNRFTVPIKAKSKEFFSYTFEFRNDVEGTEFDFSLQFEKPSSSFSFFDITNDCF